MTIAIFARVLLALGVAGGCTLASRSLIHLFQLESYQFPGYRRSILRAWAAQRGAGIDDDRAVRGAAGGRTGRWICMHPRVCSSFWRWRCWR